MGQALYRSHRPKSFDEVKGQDHITNTLRKAIKNGRIAHAYLFTGPRGVGKTSVARILAHEVNDLPYEDESIHLDIIEIDAASNRRIDEIRELRDKVHISPTSAKYKVYIIDEVHMLTREAFNALLKTLEEPPAHCIFILATTEAHKLPETIVSRTQRFEFKPISRTPAVDHLSAIAKSEKLDIDKAALELLAEHGEGSFRDSISLLDQLTTTGSKITEKDVREFLGLPAAALIKSLVESIAAGNTAEVLKQLDEVREQGANPGAVAKMLGAQVRQLLLDGARDAWVGDLLKELIEVPASFRPGDSLELAVLRAAAAAGTNTEPPVSPPPKVSSDPQIKSAEPPEPKQKVAPAKTEAAPAVVEEKKAEEPAKKPAKARQVMPFDENSWEQIVSQVKDQAASLYTALRLATPEVDSGKLTLAFQFPLHQKKVNEAENKALIGQIVAQVTGQEMAIDSVVDKSKKPTAKPAEKKEKTVIKPADESLGTISNIFGNAEVLESN
ncbi:MAG TPA: DNA polymerase III subunit gamma/tau [Candidatus Saccharimonadales bacterium]|nr:DNA polymerase III subunit gamma/tau [Candidatus Saccharimonadales bacterium]